MSSNHFTAVVEVFQVEASGTVSQPTKDKQEIARLVLRADTLAGLQAKLAAHVALIEN
jgi:hypothetical protein